MDCEKIRLKWEICSAKTLFVNDNNFQNEMNACFIFFKQYRECLMKNQEKNKYPQINQNGNH